MLNQKSKLKIIMFVMLYLMILMKKNYLRMIIIIKKIEEDYEKVVKLVGDIELGETKANVNGNDKLDFDDKIVKIALDRYY